MVKIPFIIIKYCQKIIYHLPRERIKLPNIDYSIIMSKSLLSNLQNHKYLGVILDSKMSWLQHIAYVKNKVVKGIGIMFKGRNLINLYNAYI